MRHLWFIAAIMVFGGILLVLGSLVAGLGPVVLVGGVLLAWSGLIKAVVLRVWRTTLVSPHSPAPPPATPRLAAPLSQRS